MGKDSKKKVLGGIGGAIVAILILSAFTVGMSVTISPSDAAIETSGFKKLLEELVVPVLLGIIVVGVGMAFLPFRRSQSDIPAFFRAHFFVPVLFALWFLGGLLFPFSPHQLTRTMPDFLLGANDWGTGNIYTYTKLADWLGLLAGCAACADLADDRMLIAHGVAKRLRICRPHLLAAAVLHLGMSLCSDHALATDLLFLFAWLLVGFFSISFLQSLSEKSRNRFAIFLAWLIAFGWLFVPVARFRP